MIDRRGWPNPAHALVPLLVAGLGGVTPEGAFGATSDERPRSYLDLSRGRCRYPMVFRWGMLVVLDESWTWPTGRYRIELVGERTWATPTRTVRGTLPTRCDFSWQEQSDPVRIEGNPSLQANDRAEVTVPGARCEGWIYPTLLPPLVGGFYVTGYAPVSFELRVFRDGELVRSVEATPEYTWDRPFGRRCGWIADSVVYLGDVPAAFRSPPEGEPRAE